MAVVMVAGPTNIVRGRSRVQTLLLTYANGVKFTEVTRWIFTNEMWNSFWNRMKNWIELNVKKVWSKITHVEEKGHKKLSQTFGEWIERLVFLDKGEKLGGAVCTVHKLKWPRELTFEKNRSNRPLPRQKCKVINTIYTLTRVRIHICTLIIVIRYTYWGPRRCYGVFARLWHNSLRD